MNVILNKYLRVSKSLIYKLDNSNLENLFNACANGQHFHKQIITYIYLNKLHLNY